MKKQQPKGEYRLAFEIHDEKAHIIVYEPILTEEEAEKRMNELKKAVKVFWEDYYRRKTIRERKDKRRQDKTNHTK